MKKFILLLFVCLVLIPCEISSFRIVPISEQIIHVEIRGHVQNEGIYEFQRGTTLNDALSKAGLLENSSLYDLNLTQILHDQDVITITEKKQQLVYLNSATLAELMSLPGIGEKTALRIIQYRSEHLFQTLEELMNVSGIGEKKFHALKGLIGL